MSFNIAFEFSLTTLVLYLIVTVFYDKLLKDNIQCQPQLKVINLKELKEMLNFFYMKHEPIDRKADRH